MLNHCHNDCSAVRAPVIIDGDQAMSTIRPNITTEHHGQLYDEPADLIFSADLIYAKLKPTTATQRHASLLKQSLLNGGSAPAHLSFAKPSKHMDYSTSSAGLE
jgi:hypothetical protein